MPLRQAVEPEVFEFFDYKRYMFSLGLRTNEGVWLSGHSASRYDPGRDRIVVDGDMSDQVQVAHAKIKAILAAAGLGFENVVKMNDYVTVAGIDSYQRVLDYRQEMFGAHRPPVTTVVVDRLLRPEALLEIEVVASGKPAQVFELEKPAPGAPGAAAVRIGNLVYVSGQVALAEDGNIVGKGNLLAQTRKVYETLDAALQKAGVSTRHIVKTVDYLHQSARDDYKHTAQLRKEFLAEPYPAATGILLSRLPHAEALIEVDAFAWDGDREVVNPGWSRYEKLTYSPAIRTEGYLFLAGQFSMNPATLEPEFVDDIVGQTRNVYQNLLKVLAAGGLSEGSMLKTVEYVVHSGLPQYRETATVRQQLFSAPYPAATGVVIPELLRPGMLIEVDSVAKLR